MSDGLGGVKYCDEVLVVVGYGGGMVPFWYGGIAFATESNELEQNFSTWIRQIRYLSAGSGQSDVVECLQIYHCAPFRADARLKSQPNQQ